MKQVLYTVASNRPLTADVWEMALTGDTSAITAPGQFVNIKLEGLYLRRPISVCRWDEEGLTILCTAGDFDVLITGDMGSSTEKLLVETYDLPDIEVLVVGHHGSKYATTEELLEAVTPEIGVISVGENNFGHPTAEAMDRMAWQGMTLYRTDLQGNIVIQVGEEDR